MLSIACFLMCLRRWCRRSGRWKQPKLQHLVPTKWGWTVAYPRGLTIGHGTDIGNGTYIHAGFGVEIGSNVLIGGNCCIYSNNTINGTNGRVVIKDGTRIGAFSLILPNTTLEGYYGAYSLVYKSPHGQRHLRRGQGTETKLIISERRRNS